MVKWKQCPYCATWFVANRRQVYCKPICGQRYRSLIAQVEREIEKEKYHPLHYVSIKGDMYIREENYEL